MVAAYWIAAKVAAESLAEMAEETAAELPPGGLGSRSDVWFGTSCTSPPQLILG